jgi:hypothetical protein
VPSWQISRRWTDAGNQTCGGGLVAWLALVVAAYGDDAPARWPWFNANPAPRVWAHELGHSLGLHHSGGEGAGVLNCKPHYPSIMNYAYSPGPDDVEFSSGEFDSVPLWMTDLDEPAGLGAGASLVFLEREPFHLLVQGSSVDWDRDGDYESGTIANVTAGWDRDCENPQWAIGRPDWFSSAVGTPQLAQIGGFLSGYQYAFYQTSYSLRYTRGLRREMSDCEPYDAECSPTRWGGPVTILPAFAGRGVGVERFVSDREYLVVVLCDAVGRLVARRLWHLGLFGDEEWSSWFDLSGHGTCRDEPELVVWPWDGRLRVLYRRQDDDRIGMIRINDDWSPTDLGPIQLSQPAASAVTGVSPSVAVSPPYLGAGPQVTVVHTDPVTRQIRAFRTQNGTTWLRRNQLFGTSPSFGQQTEHKMGFVWQRWPSHQTGRFWLAWNMYGGDNRPYLAFTDHTGTLERDMVFNNQWTHSRTGVDLFVDTAAPDGRDRIRAIDLQPTGSSWNYLRFWQHADGVYEVPLCDYDDWSAMRFWTCASIVRMTRSWNDTLAYCLGDPYLGTACSSWLAGSLMPRSGEVVTCNPVP